MKAVTFRSYGPPSVLRLEDLPKPYPKENEILVKLSSSAVNQGDLHIRAANPWAVRLVFGFFKPRNPILGSVFAGEIEKIGNKVTKFQVGDRIFGMTGFGLGTYAEYKCFRESATICHIPAKCSFNEAAALPFGGLTALHFLKLCSIKPGQKVLIYGASGSVGTAAVQYAKFLGAEVTAICSSSNFELVKSLGADRTIDYMLNDFSKEAIVYDVIFETVGKSNLKSNLHALSKKGFLILGAANFTDTLKGYWISLTSSQKVISGVSSELKENLTEICKLFELGKFHASIDKIYPLEDLAQAHTYADLGHKRGNVVIEIHRNNDV
jgi:NADPH:quinone reductase-like Zn-dependent oxidoreductase